MGKPQIAIRMPQILFDELSQYVEKTGTSKTDVVVSAIAEYLGCAENKPLTQRVAELEVEMKELKALVKSGLEAGKGEK